MIKRYRSGVMLLAVGVILLSLCSGCTVQDGGQADTSAQTETIDEGSTLYIEFYKIGKADAALLTVTDVAENPFSVLIDTGEADDAAEIIEKVRGAGVSELDYLILTHFDKDHIGGFPSVLANLPAKNILLPAYTGEGEAYNAMQKTLSAADGVTVLHADTAFSFGEITFAVSVPHELAYEKNQDNNSSLCVTVTYGDTRMLFAGDAEKLRQAELLADGVGDVTLLKVPHHGVWNKGLDDFFAACKPAYAIITDSDTNPAEDKTQDALDALGTVIYETRNGDVFVTVTRDKMTVEQS